MRRRSQQHRIAAAHTNCPSVVCNTLFSALHRAFPDPCCVCLLSMVLKCCFMWFVCWCAALQAVQRLARGPQALAAAAAHHGGSRALQHPAHYQTGAGALLVLCNRLYMQRVFESFANALSGSAECLFCAVGSRCCWADCAACSKR
jgi:hypothetical protein